MAAFSPRRSLPAAHEYVRVPADMHPRLVRLTSPSITNRGLNRRCDTSSRPSVFICGSINRLKIVGLAVGVFPDRHVKILHTPLERGFVGWE